MEKRIRFFDRKDYHTVHGEDALYIARNFYKTTSVVKCTSNVAIRLSLCLLPPFFFLLFSLFLFCLPLIDSPSSPIPLLFLLLLLHGYFPSPLSISLADLGKGDNPLPSVTLNRSLFETVLRDLLVDNADHTIEIYEGSGSSWRPGTVASPGNLAP